MTKVERDAHLGAKFEEPALIFDPIATALENEIELCCSALRLFAEPREGVFFRFWNRITRACLGRKCFFKFVSSARSHEDNIVDTCTTLEIINNFSFIQVQGKSIAISILG